MVKMKSSGIEVFVEDRDVKRFETMGYTIVSDENTDQPTKEPEAPKKLVKNKAGE